MQQVGKGQPGEGRRGSHSTSTGPISKGVAVQPFRDMTHSSAAGSRQPNAALQQGKKRKRSAVAAVEDLTDAKLARQGSSNSPGAAATAQAGGGEAGAAVAAVVRHPVSTVQLRPRLYKRLTEDKWFHEDGMAMYEF